MQRNPFLDPPAEAIFHEVITEFTKEYPTRLEIMTALDDDGDQFCALLERDECGALLGQVNMSRSETKTVARALEALHEHMPPKIGRGGAWLSPASINAISEQVKDLEAGRRGITIFKIGDKVRRKDADTPEWIGTVVSRMVPIDGPPYYGVSWDHHGVYETLPGDLIERRDNDVNQQD